MSNTFAKWFRNLKSRVSRQDVTLLDLSCSALKELSDETLANCERSLEELNLELNQIEILPLTVFSCAELRVLNVTDNCLRLLQPAVGSLLNLEELYLSKNRLESIPETLKSCRKLRVIDASFNPLSRLTQLKHLDLRGNCLDSLPASFSRLTLLETLDLGCNNFTQFPPQLTFLVSLKQFWIDQNDIKVLPDSLNSLENLEALDVSRNCLSCLPEQIGGLASLSLLDCSGNELHYLPQSFGCLKSLTTLKLENNQLKILPSTISNLSCLSEISLSGNQLQKLPDNFGRLHDLTNLYCDENLLTTLPSSIGDLSRLVVLSLRSNGLCALPDQLGKLPALRVLNLSGNQIRFLPVTLVNLIRNLSALWLSESQVSPKVPLQCQRDSITKKEVLTCFLLPQQKRQTLLTTPDKNFPSSSTGKRLDRKMELKKLSFMATEPQNHLERRPTPVVRRKKLPSLHTPTEVFPSQMSDAGATVFMAKPELKSERLVVGEEPNRRLNDVLSKISTATPLRKTSSRDLLDADSPVFAAPKSFTKASAECLSSTSPANLDDTEEWLIMPGQPPLIKPYAMVDLRTLQLQMRMESEGNSNGQNSSACRPYRRRNSLQSPYNNEESSSDNSAATNNHRDRHYESIFDHNANNKRRSCLPDIVAAHTTDVSSYQNLPM